MNNSFLIHLDKASFNLKVNDGELIESFRNSKNLAVSDRIIVNGGFNPLSSKYDRRVDIFLDGKFVGHLAYSRWQLKNTKLIQLHIAKEILYVKDNFWIKVTDTLLVAFNLTFDSIHLLEIAYDSAGLLDGQNTFYTKSTIVGQRDYKKYGRMPVKPFSSTGRKNDTYYIGGKISVGKDGVYQGLPDVGVKVYDKVKEAETKNQQYILDYFELNGLDLNKGVDRCELTIKGRLLRGVVDHYSMLYGQDILLTIFKEFGQNHLKWYDLNSFEWRNGNRVYDTVCLIDFSVIPFPVLNFDTIPSVFSAALKTYKTLIQNLYWQYAKMGDPSVRECIKHYMKTYPDLRKWVFRNFRHWNPDPTLQLTEEVKKRLTSMLLLFFMMEHRHMPYHNW